MPTASEPHEEVPRLVCARARVRVRAFVDWCGCGRLVRVVFLGFGLKVDIGDDMARVRGEDANVCMLQRKPRKVCEWLQLLAEVWFFFCFDRRPIIRWTCDQSSHKIREEHKSMCVTSSSNVCANQAHRALTLHSRTDPPSPRAEDSQRVLPRTLSHVPNSDHCSRSCALLQGSKCPLFCT